MWTTVLVMAIAVSFEPFRIGLTILMLSRPRPMLQLLALLCGGFAMGMGVGLVVLFVLGDKVLSATGLTVPKVQVAIGLLALLLAAALATNLSARQFQRGPRPRAAVGGDTDVAEPARESVLDRLSVRTRRVLRGDSLWVAGVVGSGIALPSVDYLAALAVILASGAAPAVQVGALVTFNVVAFALVEIPLVAHLVAPARTRTAMAALYAWIRSRRRREVAALLAAAGCIMLLVGLAGL